MVLCLSRQGSFSLLIKFLWSRRLWCFALNFYLLRINLLLAIWWFVINPTQETHTCVHVHVMTADIAIVNNGAYHISVAPYSNFLSVFFMYKMSHLGVVCFVLVSIFHPNNSWGKVDKPHIYWGPLSYSQQWLYQV